MHSWPFSESPTTPLEQLEVWVVHAPGCYPIGFHERKMAELYANSHEGSPPVRYIPEESVVRERMRADRAEAELAQARDDVRRLRQALGNMLVIIAPGHSGFSDKAIDAAIRYAEQVLEETKDG